jgi:hypothetical protein
MRRLKIAALVIAAIPLCLWLWSAARLARLERHWKADMAADRARVAAERRPPLRGEARPVNGAPEYLAALEHFTKGFGAAARYVDDDEIDVAIGKAADAAPAPLPPEIAAELARRSVDLVAICEATRAERCDFDLEPSLDKSGTAPDPVALIGLTGLLVLEGHERERAGDFRIAAELYLDLARFGADMDHGGPFPIIWLGTALRAGLGALEREIAAGGLRAEDLAEVDRELATLEGLFEPSASVIRRERLRQDGRWISMGSGLVFERFYIGLPGFDGPKYDAIVREAEEALLTPDHAARKERLTRVIANGEKSSVLPIRWAMVYLDMVPRERGKSEAHVRLARAAAAVARARLERGSFPESLAEATTAPLLDPFDGKPLRYSRSKDGSTAKIWSVGPNEVDDGGTPPSVSRPDEADIVVELTARPK